MDELEPIVAAIHVRASVRRPFVVGISGAVAAGKTTIAEALAGVLGAQLISTDCFLLSNSVLDGRDLTLRKGFPETYDHDEIHRVMRSVRAGRSTQLREYSHRTYDIVEGSTLTFDVRDIVLVEGIVALQSPVSSYIDLGVYVEADEPTVRTWFVERFLRFVGDARGDPGSFYHAFAAFPDEQIIALAEATWDTINGPNLAEHIAPTRREADFVIRKGAGHSILKVTTVSGDDGADQSHRRGR